MDLAKRRQMHRLALETLKTEAENRGVVLERIDLIRNGVRYLYEITNQHGVWKRCKYLPDTWNEIVNWENRDIFFIV